MEIRLEFYECEHDGDLNHYLDDVTDSGGRVKESMINHDAEIGSIVIEVADRKDFFEKFKQTEAYEFLN